MDDDHFEAVYQRLSRFFHEPRYRTAIVRASPKIDFDRGRRDRAIGLGLEVTGFHAFYIAMLKAVTGTANQP